MTEAIDIISQSMQADLNQLRTVSTNLANLNTTAYKSEVSTTSSFYDAMQGKSSLTEGKDLPQVVTDVTRSLSQGGLKPTGNDLDIALDGIGMFVANSDGQTFYTRGGELSVNNAGRLALASGESIQGASGDIFVGSKPFEVNKKGEIIQDGKVIDRFMVVHPERQGSLEYAGGGKFVAGNSAAAMTPSEGHTVMQGYLEGSNVDSASEVINMMQTLRHFETSSRIIQTYDQMVGHSITELGKF